MNTSGISALLPEAMLSTFRERAHAYDRDNTFFTEDLEDLRETGYLKAPVPAEFGGAGLSVAELTLAQRRLAEYAPSTALGVNMHLLWVTVAKLLFDAGDHRLEWVLRDAAAGEIFAFGISEAGNEAILLDAFSTAVPDGSGDYLISGTKIFTTLAPVWTRLGLHARDNSNLDEPKLVFGFARREPLDGGAVRSQTQGGEGISHPDPWNPLGMRATQSWNTKLDEVRVLAGDVAAVVDPYDPSDLLIPSISATFATLTSSVYVGIADRAVRLVIAEANTQAGDGIKLDDPDLAAKVTEAVLAHRRSVDALELIASDIDAGVDREDMALALAAVKNHTTDEARAAVDAAIRIVGSRAFDADSELARMYRDVLAGIFHPRSSKSLAAAVRESIQQ